jgi:hypothetical protein
MIIFHSKTEKKCRTGCEWSLCWNELYASMLVSVKNNEFWVNKRMMMMKNTTLWCCCLNTIDWKVNDVQCEECLLVVSGAVVENNYIIAIWKAHRKNKKNNSRPEWISTIGQSVVVVIITYSFVLYSSFWRGK